ncbi:MAG: hypothetical protein UT25_C0005G0001, partial [Parcubacteria group bacterium GW2011_GWC1_39_12]
MRKVSGQFGLYIMTTNSNDTDAGAT